MYIKSYLAGWVAAALFSTAPAAVTSFTLVHEGSSNTTLWGICKGPAGAIAVGSNGAILQSVDGTTWSAREAHTSTWLLGATYGNGRYIIVGDGGIILSSVDGTAWNRVGEGVTSQRLNQVLYGHGHFVAVGELNTFLYSVDGSNWKLGTLPATPQTPNASVIPDGWLRGLATNHQFGTDGALNFPSWILPLPSEMWVAAGQNGLFFESIDGQQWHRAGAATGGADVESLTFTRHTMFVSPGVLAVSAQFIAAGDGFPTLSVSALMGAGSDAGPYSFTPSPNGILDIIPRATSSAVRFRGSALNDLALPPMGSVQVPYTTYVAAGESSTMLSQAADPLDANIPPSTLPASQFDHHINAAIFFNQRCVMVGESESIYISNQNGETQLANISSRGFVGNGEQVMILGTIVTGSTPKRVLVRGLGPTLTDYNINNVLPDPEIQVYDGKGGLITQVTAWTKSDGAADVTNAIAQVGATPLQAARADSALVLTLPPGGYTFILRSASGKNGVALLEAYDLDGESPSSRFANVSTRAAVGPGEKTLIAGLIINGTEAKRVLLRGIGPLLKTSGVKDALEDPVLSIYKGSQQINNNDNWGTVTTGEWVYGRNVSAQELSLLMKTAGVTSLDDSPNEAALVVKLSPGAYTIQLTGKNGSSGTALVEAYELSD